MADTGGMEGRRPRRRVRIMCIVVAGVLITGIGAWQVAAWTTVVGPGSMSDSGAGATLPDCVPGDDIWAMFGTEEDAVVLQTVRNSSRWPVTLISTDPEAYRFEPMADDDLEDLLFVSNPADGAPDHAATSDRVVVPPGREAALWVINPQGDARIGSGWRTFHSAPVKLRALGIERDFDLPFRAVLAVGGDEATAGRLDSALQEACEA
jgi:hypothetical protein